jgi:hypothetical protein
MHMWHHVTNHLIISNDKDSNSENRIKLRVHDTHLSLCHTALSSHLPVLVLESRHRTPSSHTPSLILLHYLEAWSLLASNTNTLTFLLPLCTLLLPYSHLPLLLSSRLPHATSTSLHALLYPLACPPLSTHITLVAWLLMPALPHPLAVPDLHAPS